MPHVLPSFDESADCVELLDVDGRVLWTNASRRQFCQSAQLPCEVGDSWFEWWAVSERPAVAEEMAAAARSGVARFTATGAGHLASPISWDVALMRRHNAGESSASFLSVARDVTRYVLASAERDATASREHMLRLEIERESRERDYAILVAVHELGAPLYAVRGWAQYLQLGHLTPDEFVEAAEAIGRNTARQYYLVERLLEIAKFRSQHGAFRLEPYPLTDILTNAIDCVRAVARVRQIDVTVRIATPVWVSADFDQLQRAFSNILFNAVKFGRPGGHVSVTSTAFDERVRIEFADNGAGIDAAFIGTIFEPFSQETISPSTIGMGLGLSIVRRIVEGHHGVVSAASEGHGQGATFVIELPQVSRAAVG